jgi:hypothetical protein
MLSRWRVSIPFGPLAGKTSSGSHDTCFGRVTEGPLHCTLSPPVACHRTRPADWGIRMRTTVMSLQYGGTGGEAGVALNVILIANNTLLKLITSWSALDISFGAVERLSILEQFTTAEDRIKVTLRPAAEWPTAGALEMDSVTAGCR